MMYKERMENNMENVIMPLYKWMVHPNLEYWSPHFKKHAAELEEDHRWAMKMTRGMGKLSQKKREKNGISLP